jgi:hypothetical protein
MPLQNENIKVVHTKIREESDNRGRKTWLNLKSRVDMDGIISLLLCLQCAYSFSKSTKVVLNVQGSWYSYKHTTYNGIRSGYPYYNLNPLPHLPEVSPIKQIEIYWSAL